MSTEELKKLQAKIEEYGDLQWSAGRGLRSDLVKADALLLEIMTIIKTYTGTKNDH